MGTPRRLPSDTKCQPCELDIHDQTKHTPVGCLQTLAMPPIDTVCACTYAPPEEIPMTNRVCKECGYEYQTRRDEWEAFCSRHCEEQALIGETGMEQGDGAVNAEKFLVTLRYNTYTSLSLRILSSSVISLKTKALSAKSRRIDGKRR